MKTINLDGVEYVKAEDVNVMANCGTWEYVIIRTYSAGVHAGYLQSREGKEVVLRNARRIWYWEGAATLSQLAMEGTSKPDDCKFPCEVDSITLTEAIEVIPCTEKARESIQGVPVWEE